MREPRMMKESLVVFFRCLLCIYPADLSDIWEEERNEEDRKENETMEKEKNEQEKEKKARERKGTKRERTKDLPPGRM
jgi:hypothetical protein